MCCPVLPHEAYSHIKYNVHMFLCVYMYVYVCVHLFYCLSEQKFTETPGQKQGMMVLSMGRVGDCIFLLLLLFVSFFLFFCFYFWECLLYLKYSPLWNGLFILTGRGGSILRLALCFQKKKKKKSSYLLRTSPNTWFISSHWLMTDKSNVSYHLHFYKCDLYCCNNERMAATKLLTEARQWLIW